MKQNKEERRALKRKAKDLDKIYKGYVRTEKLFKTKPKGWDEYYTIKKKGYTYKIHLGKVEYIKDKPFHHWINN